MTFKLGETYGRFVTQVTGNPLLPKDSDLFAIVAALSTSDPNPAPYWRVIEGNYHTLRVCTVAKRAEISDLFEPEPEK